MNRLSILILLVGAIHGSAFGNGFDAAYQTIRADEIASRIAVLASDEFEGREPGTPGEDKTLRFLEDAFRAAGARPGVGASYRQPVPLAEVRRDGVPRLEITGGKSKLKLVFETDFVALAGKPVTKVELEKIPVVFAGHGTSAEEYGWDDYGGRRVDGAAVLLLRGEPNSETDSTLFRGRALTFHGISSTKLENAARHGARAAIIVHTEKSAGFPWQVLTGGGMGGVQHFLSALDGHPTLDFVAHVSEPAARRLFAAAGLDYDAQAAAANQRGFVAVDTPLRATARAQFTTKSITSHNVVAMIPGREAADECIVYTGHWDHVGRNDKLEGDGIFNGAVDNATGTSALVELAEAYAALPKPPRRTVYFVATTAEEKGLLGSEYLARNPICPLAQTVAVLNLDALFPFGSFGAMTVTALGSSEIEDVLKEAAARLGRVLQDDDAPQVGAFYRSDHYPFAKRGVPALFAVGNPRPDEAPEGSPMAERFAAYLANGYHKPADEYDPATWDMRGIEGDVRAYFETGWRLAEETRWPNWYYGNEFRALRDRMRTR